MKKLAMAAIIGVTLAAGIPQVYAETGARQSELAKVAAAYRYPPVDARVDRVWKLIPALNGIALDLQKTSRQWNTDDPAATKLAFTQIPPAVLTGAYPAEPIYRGNPQKRQMALMFNVAWGEEYLSGIMATLVKYHVKSTFFLDGKWAGSHPGLVKQLLAAGMEIGDHGYNHHLFSHMTQPQMRANLAKSNATIQAAAGKSPTLFAPPAGDFNQEAVKVAAGFGMKTVLWTLDTVDWRRPQPEVIAMRVLMKKTPGALVLMHPTSPTAQALGRIIENLHKAGYQLVTVSELLSPVRPHPDTLQAALAGLRSPR